MRYLFFLSIGLLLVLNTSAQRSTSVKISGIVTDEFYKPIAGAFVSIKYHQHTISDSSGIFQIEANAGDTLMVQHIAYAKRQVVVKKQKQQRLMLRLKPLLVELGEVIVSGYYSGNVQDMMIAPVASDRDVAAATYNLNLYSYAAGTGIISPEWNNEDRQKMMIHRYEHIITDKDLQNSMNSGVYAPYTSILNTNTLLTAVGYFYAKHKQKQREDNYRGTLGILKYRYQQKVVSDKKYLETQVLTDSEY